MRSRWPGCWVCVDGVEGAGKTTLTEGLIKLVQSEGISEFSDSVIGIALREAVRSAPHYISQSALGQSLVFLGDFVELYEAKVLPALQRGELVFTDRGWLTKYAYQRVVLEDSLTAEMADGLLRSILAFVGPPDLSILLTAPLPVLQSRLIERDGFCGADRSRFISRAEVALRDFGMSLDGHVNVVSISSDREVDEVVADALAAVRRVQMARQSIGGSAVRRERALTDNKDTRSS